MIKEIGRIIITLALLGLAGLFIYLGVVSGEVVAAAGLSGLAGTIIGAVLTYWLKP